MINVGITGQAGFIGTHLFNTLRYLPDNYKLINFEDEYFDSPRKLESFVSNCNVIVHLAAMNRHNDPEIIYKTNIGLVNKLISALEKTNSHPHVLFSSSIQENNNSSYGKSKKDGREMLESWAKRNNACFTGLVISNVYGPFGNPYYNSAVATFCHQITHNEKPKIDVDGELKLIFVGELVSQIIYSINLKEKGVGNCFVNTVMVPYTKRIKVSLVLKILKDFQKGYLTTGQVPDLDDSFIRNIFNTFVSYIDHSSFFPFYLKKHSDERGSFVETVKVKCGGQVSFSTTAPGVTRGNHFHTRKTERFAVIKGKARIDIRKIGTNKVNSFELDGHKPSFVDMPIWYTHRITNVGDEDLYTIFWINEEFNSADPDTYYEEI